MNRYILQNVTGIHKLTEVQAKDQEYSLIVELSYLWRVPFPYLRY